MPNRFSVTYRITADSDQIGPLAAALAIEQSVETPLEVANRYAYVREHMVGEVRNLLQRDETEWDVELGIPIASAAADPAQLLNVVFGNASLFPNVELVGMDLPPELLSSYRGPRFGIEGVRRLANAPHRPLTCSALKPIGLPADRMADLCYAFAAGGMDVVKDDHYLADHSFCPFEDRVRACVAAIERAADKTGKRTLYAPNLSGTPSRVRSQAEFAAEAGAGALMVAPMLLGFPSVHEILDDVRLPVLAHPSFSGALRIAPEIMIGRLFRLFGADVVIFANYGGRFSYSKEACLAVADHARAPWAAVEPAMPAPAGGMRTGRVKELVDVFGADVMLLIGGSLLEAGPLLRDRTRDFLAAVNVSLEERTDE
jgi:ribulose-bisphosphate carboxylase large chain